MLSVLCILIALPAAAAGQKDVTFSEIDALIADRNYNAALSLLDTYIRQNPEDFDSAQKRIDSIMTARDEYHTVADNLLSVIQNEPTNDKKKLDMITQLESLEKNPNALTQAFIRETKAAAQFTFYRARFEEIMTNGKNQLLAGAYPEAIDTFKSGMMLYRDEYFEEDYDRDTYKVPVTQALAQLDAMTAQFETARLQLDTAVAAYRQRLQEKDLPGSQAAYRILLQSFGAYADIRNAAAETGWLMKDTFESLQARYPGLTEASFLPFASRFVLGKSSDPETGIIAVFDRQALSYLPELKTLAADLAKDCFLRTAGTLDGTTAVSYPAEHTQTRALLLDTGQALQLALDTDALAGLFYAAPGIPAESGDADYTASMAYSQMLAADYTAYLDEVRAFSETVRAEQLLVAPAQPQTDVLLPDSAYTAALTGNAAVYAQHRDTVASLAAAAQAAFGSYDGQNDRWQAEYDTFMKLCGSFADTGNARIASSWLALAGYLQQGIGLVSDRYAAEYDNALVLLNEKDTGDTAEQNPSYPAEALPVLNSILQTIGRDREQIAARRTLLDTAPAAVATAGENGDGAYQAAVASIAASMEQLELIQARTPQLTDTARQRITLAERARNEAELRYSQAVSALNADRFDSARENLQRSRTKYNESLVLQESVALRARSDEILTQLGLDINRAENEIVIREVRQLKTAAKNAYYSGNFELAENLLVQAQTRWNVTNVDPDQEITNMLVLVGTAISMKTGRVIPPTAPLYPEMSQILSMANQYYDQGQKLIAQGNRAEAVAILNQAKQKLRELQLVYPINQEASLLTLRIDKLTDPDSFETLFEQKFRTAQTDYRDPQKRQTAYSDLLDLYEINPGYRGLGDFIYRVEIELGIRIPPPDPAALRRSAALTAEARQTVNTNSRNEIAMNAALQQLDEAIRLNPDNEEAMILKDRVQIAIGGQAVVVLAAAAEALYQRAVQELQKGNTIEASAIVAQLLQNPQNQRSAKILDLKKKVDSLL